MAAEKAAEAGNSFDYEKVMAIIDRLSAEADKRAKEEAERFRQEAERSRELDKRFAEITEQRARQEAERAKQEAERAKQEAERANELDKRLAEISEQRSREEAERAQELDKRLAAIAEQQAREKAERVREEAERVKELDKRLAAIAEQRTREEAERYKELDKRLAAIAKQQEKNERLIERVSKNIGGLNRSMGELVETLISGRLWEKFEKYHLKRAYRRIPIHDDTDRLRTDIDILLLNTVYAMVVEVKRDLNKKEDVREHLKRMELVLQYPPDITLTGKRVMGAMAGAVVDPDVAAYAYECGFFVLELSGEMVQLVPPPTGFEPKEWS
jgi:DNA repair exonuclease SbcCD ATPase subunit